MTDKTNASDYNWHFFLKIMNVKYDKIGYINGFRRIWW